MNRKKFIAVALSTTLLMSVITGCAKKSDSSDKTTAETSVTETSAAVTTTTETTIAEESEETTEETTEESEETSETTEETEPETTEETSEITIETETTLVSSTNESSTLYTGVSCDEFRTILSNNGYEFEEFDDEMIAALFNNCEGCNSAFISAQRTSQGFYIVGDFDTAEHARYVYDFILSDENFEYTYIIENGSEAAYYEEPDLYCIVYYNEANAVTVIAMLPPQ